MEYYSKDVIKSIPASVLLHPLFDEWFLIVEDILLSDEFQKRKLFAHHHNISVWDHSILVSFKSFVVAKHYNANTYICAVAGLLHDFYTQAWIKTPEIEALDNGKYAQSLKIKRKPIWKMHGFTHAKDASINYVKYFPELENKKITNSIRRHMFPLTIIPPRYKEGVIITIVDKLNSCSELPSIKDVSLTIVDKTIHLFSHKKD